MPTRMTRQLQRCQSGIPDASFGKSGIRARQLATLSATSQCRDCEKKKKALEKSGYPPSQKCVAIPRRGRKVREPRWEEGRPVRRAGGLQIKRRRRQQQHVWISGRCYFMERWQQLHVGTFVARWKMNGRIWKLEIEKAWQKNWQKE